jgi:hypothetical protein
VGLVEAERRVLLEAVRWVRALLRKDDLYSHEYMLFIAIIEWQHQLEEVETLPENSRVPSILLPPSTYRKRTETPEPSKEFDQVQTPILPPPTRVDLVRKTKRPPRTRKGAP